MYQRRCVQEPTNCHDPRAVTVVKDSLRTVGNVPKSISPRCFLREVAVYPDRRWYSRYFLQLMGPQDLMNM